MNIKKDQDLTITMTFKTLEALNHKLNEKIIADGYGMRGKSRWVREAIEKLFTCCDYAELVAISDDMKSAEHSISVRLPKQLFLAIEEAVIDIRKQFPGLEGVKSRIIRTAILQRLIRQ